MNLNASELHAPMNKVLQTSIFVLFPCAFLAARFPEPTPSSEVEQAPTPSTHRRSLLRGPGALGPGDNGLLQLHGPPGVFVDTARPQGHSQQSSSAHEPDDKPAAHKPDGKPDSSSDKSDGKSGVMASITSKQHVHSLVFALVFCGFFGSVAHKAYRLYGDFMVATENSGEHGAHFSEFLAYRFAYFMAWTSGSSMIVLLNLCTILTFLGALTYWFIVGRHSVGADIWQSVWKACVWLVAPDAGAFEKTNRGAIIGYIMSVSGLVLFAILLFLLQEAFENNMRWIRGGYIPVVESGHVVVLGLTYRTLPLIEEIAMGYKCHGGTCIAILSHEVSKGEMEEQVRQAKFNMHGSHIVVRAGQAHHTESLAMVGCDAAKTIIILADPAQEFERRDAFVMQALLSLKSEGWPAKGRTLVECSLMLNMPLFEEIGGEDLDIVMTDRWMAKLFVQCSQQRGLGAVISNTFSFRGCQFYIKPVPDQLVGLEFLEASRYYKNAVPIGVLKEDGYCSFGPGPVMERRMLHAGEELVLLADSDTHAEALPETFCEELPKNLSSRSHRGGEASEVAVGTERAPETIIIIGWSSLVGVLLVELDRVLPAGSRAIILASVDLDHRNYVVKRAQSRWQRPLTNITDINHVHGVVGSRFQLEQLAIKDASRIFILSDQESDIKNADGLTVVAIMQIRDIMANSNMTSNIPIVPEIRDNKTESQCKRCSISDYVDSSDLPIQVLTAIALEPKRKLVLKDILSEDGTVNFSVRLLQDYMDPADPVPSRLSFLDAQAYASNFGDTVVGWSVVEAEEPPPVISRRSSHIRESNIEAARSSRKQKDTFRDKMSNMYIQAHSVPPPPDWEFNPADKVGQRPWKDTDLLVVLSALSKHGLARMVTE